MPDVVTFDPSSHPPIIAEIDTGGDNTLTWQEIYSEWKDWVRADATRLGYPPAFRVVGGEPKSATESLGIAHFMLSPWKFRPSERDHLLVIQGDISYDPAGEAIVVPTLGAFTVNVLFEASTLLTIVNAGGSSSEPSTPAAPTPRRTIIS